MIRIHSITHSAVQNMEDQLTLKEHAVDNCDPQKVRSYKLYCYEVLKLNQNTLHSQLNALKFYFEQVLHRDKFFVDIHRLKKPIKLPKTLNVNDIKTTLIYTEEVAMQYVKLEDL